MRKTISIASNKVGICNGVPYPSSCTRNILPHLFKPIQRAHLHQESLLHPISPQLLLDLLQESKRVQSIKTTKAAHALAITIGPSPTNPVVLLNNIILNYASLGEIVRARHLFDKMPARNVVSYNCMIKAYARVGRFQDACKILGDMRNKGFYPTEFTLGGLLSSDVTSLFQGLQILALVVKSGFLWTGPFVGTALLGMFGRHGFLDESIRVFEDMAVKNLVTCNSMISLFGQYGLVSDSIEMFLELMKRGMGISESTVVGLLSGFVGNSCLELGKQVHGLVFKYGYEDSILVSNSLINMYAKCGEICLAEKCFDEIPAKDIVSWTSIIGVMVKSDRPEKGFAIFLRMCEDGTIANETTFVSVLSSCSRMKNPFFGEFIHAKVIKRGMESDVYVGSVLIDFYGKCDETDLALYCFDEISHKNSVSWNSLMASYANKDSSIPLMLLAEMVQSGHRPNEFSFSTLLKSALALEVQQLHSFIIKTGYDDDEYVSSSLITSYAKNGLVPDALLVVEAIEKPLPLVSSNVIAGLYNRTRQYEKTRDLFSVLEEPDIVSWNILIAACSRNGDYIRAFELFNHMLRAKITPDSYTFASLFSVCTKLNNLALGNTLHGIILKTCINCCDTLVFNIMIDMYGKCGSLESSVKIFDAMTSKNVISWTSLVSALGLNGQAHAAVQMFREMQAAGFVPDKVAYIAVISACRHVGLVQEGFELFGEMKTKYGIEPEMDHYLLTVDLLARYGHLKEAQDFIAGMPFPPNDVIWRSFLDGCKRKGLAELALAA